MTRLKFCALFLLTLFCIPLYAQTKPRLAILPFTGGSTDDAETIAEIFSYEPEINRVFTPVPRTRAVENLMREQEFQRSGLTDSDTIADLGKQLNADYVLAGHIAALGESKLLLITVIDVKELRQIAGDYREYRQIERVLDILPDMASRIARAALRDGSSLPRLAVLPFNVFSGGMDQRDAELLAQFLATELANSGAYAVFPRTSAIEKVMEEHQIERTGMTDPESIRAIGEAVNARYMLSANVRKLGADNLFTASILHIVEASQGQGAWERYQTVQDGIEIMPRLARSLTGVQAAAPPQTPADPEVPESAWTAAGDFELALAGDFLTITKYKGTADAVNIPARIDGIPVQAIGDQAFLYCGRLTSITIPDSVTSIGYYAFSYCSNLSSVTIPNSVTSIGEGAFFLCISLTSITIPADVTTIGDWAFSGCGSLASITIPSSVTSIGEGAFIGCRSLRDITVAAWNTQYCSVNGVLLSGDGTTIVHYPSGKTYSSYTIPAGVTSIGDRAFSDYNSLVFITIPDSVVSIGDWAFSGCRILVSITIPNSVTSIGDWTFSGCESLRDITVESGNEQYRSVNGVLFSGDGTTIVRYPSGKTYGSYAIPAGITTIGVCAFSDCSSLTSVTIPDNVTSIGDSAFSGCNSLASIKIPNSVTSIGDNAFSSCILTSVTIPNSVTTIGEGAFSGCDSLASAIISGGVTTIGDRAFFECSSLSSVTIPNSVTSIGDEAFSGCYSLSSVTIPNSVTSIGDEAFYHCSSLTSITIPNSVTSIGNRAFFGCNRLRDITVAAWNTQYCSVNGVLLSGDGTTIVHYPSGKTYRSYTIPAGVTTIGCWAFYNCDILTSITIPTGVTSIGDNAFSSCSLASITIPSSVTSIGEGAFSFCSSLASAIISGGVTTIGDRAFFECRSLSSVTIPNSVISIGDEAFYYCSSLTSITIPNSVTSIGDSAFFGCSSLISVTIPSSVTSIGYYTFYGCDNLSAGDRESIRRRFGDGVF